MSKSPLEDRLDELIAKDLGIKPEEIAPEFMRNWREKNLNVGERIRLDIIHARAGEFLSQFGKSE